MKLIHDTALIDPSIRIPESIEIGPFSIIYPGVILEEGVQIGSHCAIGKAPLAGMNQLPLVGFEIQTTIEANTIIGDYVKIYSGCEIGSRVYIADRATIREKSKISKDVVIGLGVVLSYETVIGSRTKIMTNSNIGGGFQIGSDCFIGLHVVMFNDRVPHENKTSRSELGKAIIGNNVMVGSNSTIFPNIVISENVIIGAGSLVTKPIDEPGVFFGNPITRIK